MNNARICLWCFTMNGSRPMNTAMDEINKDVKVYNSEIKITDVVFVAWITFVGYIAAYYYKQAYLAYFGINNLFIHIELPDILKAVSAIFVIIFFFFIALD